MNAPAPPDAAFEIALERRHAGHPVEARAALLDIIADYPAYCPALHELGLLALASGEPVEAEEWLRRALRAEPFRQSSLCALGTALFEQKRLPEAIVSFQQAIRLDRNNHQALAALAAAYQHNNDLTAAEGCWERLLVTAPQDGEIYCNLALTRRRLFKMEAAVRDFDAALARSKDDATRTIFAHTMKGLTLLSMGDWAQGWKEYEWRLKGVMHEQVAAFDALAPRWDGTPMPGRRVVVYAEQGLGDTLNFCRYLKFPIMMGMGVIVHCQEPLADLLQQSFGHHVVTVSGTVIPACDVQIPLLSLPLALAPHIGFALPKETPYLAAAPDRVAFFRQELEALAPGGRRRIAIAWRGNPGNSSDSQRSLKAEQFATLLAPDAAYFVIQPGAEAAAFHTLGHTNVHDLTRHIRDFSDTAAALTALDGLISVDTSVLHLAGALDRPVWALLAYHADWRWGLLAEATPWYPGTKLYRQHGIGDWARPLEKLAVDHAHWLSTPSA